MICCLNAAFYMGLGFVNMYITNMYKGVYMPLPTNLYFKSLFQCLYNISFEISRFFLQHYCKLLADICRTM